MSLKTPGINPFSSPGKYYKNKSIYENLGSEVSNLANYLVHRISLLKNGLSGEGMGGGFAVAFNQLINDLGGVTETPPDEKNIKAVASALNKASLDRKTISTDELIGVYLRA